MRNFKNTAGMSTQQLIFHFVQRSQLFYSKTKGCSRRYATEIESAGLKREKVTLLKMQQLGQEVTHSNNVLFLPLIGQCLRLLHVLQYVCSFNGT
jgi:hypothetical protein